MSKNRLYTRSYFIKRLVDSKIKCIPLINTFSEDDIRKWSVLVLPSTYNILCTCYKKTMDEYWFKFDTEKKSNMQVKTQSMNVIIEFIQHYIEENAKTDINIENSSTNVNSS